MGWRGDKGKDEILRVARTDRGGALLGHRMNGCLLGVYGALRGDFAGVDSGLGGRDGRAFCAGMGERLSYRELIQ